jgi:hypothetical protein
MGLLDDAIREHLELKRRHGADPGEVERQEREALGAARGGEFAPEGGPAPPPAAPFDADDSVPEAAEPPEFDERAAPAPEPDEPAAAPPEPPPEAAAVAAGFEEDPWLEEERDEVPADEALDQPSPAAPDDEVPEGEDVLEETPDFLQETPEHDRLWFEQRPPRDFDWDK